MSTDISGAVTVCFYGMSTYTSQSASSHIWSCYSLCGTSKHTLLKLIWFVSVIFQHKLQGLIWPLSLAC